MPRANQFCTFLALLFLPFFAQATHIVGGEMTYTYLGNDLYRIRLDIFRDCYNGVPWFDDPASIGVFLLSNDSLVQEVLVDLSPVLNDTIDPTLNSDCFVVPPNVCVHTTSYTTTVSLPYDPNGYHIVYQRCCRNNTISNLIAPEDVGATYSIIVGPDALALNNSSPVFNNWPPLFLCVNKPFAIDQSAVDPDGDSLVYVLCNPLSGADPIFPIPQPPNPPPYDTVPWLAPYNVNNQIGGTPTMTIDPVTGLLTGNPNATGQFVIGLCVEEYRNGILIGTKRRDYQVNIGICGIPTAAFFAPNILCDGFTVTVDNQSFSADQYLWQFNDPNNPGSFSTLPEPSYTYSDTGNFQITLIAEPGTICADTFSTDVDIFYNSLIADYEVLNANCEDELTIQVSNISSDSIYGLQSWEWTLVQGTNIQTSTDSTPIFTVTEIGVASLVLVATSTNSCQDTVVFDIPVTFFEDSAKDSTAFCVDSTGIASLNPNDIIPGAVYSWFPENFLDNPNLPNPLATVPLTTTFEASVQGANGYCEEIKKVTLLMPPDVVVNPVLDTIKLGESVEIMVGGSPANTYQWSPSDGLDDPNSSNPTASPVQDIVYTLLVTDENGCVNERTVSIVVITTCEEPYVFIPTGFTPNGDQKNDTFRVIGNYLEEVYLVVYNRWGEKMFETKDPTVGWDGTYKGKELPPDAYGFYAEIKCVDGVMFYKKGNVTLIR